MKKGEVLIYKSGRVYQIAGRWDRDVVLSPVEEDDEQVLVYTASELETLISEGKFRKLHKTELKVKNSEN